MKTSRKTSKGPAIMARLSSLPPEILREVLSHLPIQSLLAFGQTSKYNHSIQAISLTKLRLGVFPTRLHSMLSLMEATENQDTTHSVQIILEKRKSRKKDTVISNQNAIISRIVQKHQHTLRSLEVALWELQASSAKAISQLQRLRHLSVRLDHPNTRHADVDRNLWKTSPGSTLWNHFYSQKGDQRILGRLESLNLERAGITDYQLEKILEGNPGIVELRLQKCLIITGEFFERLVQTRAGKYLELLYFTHSDNPEIDERVLGHIGKLGRLKVSAMLSLPVDLC